MNHEEKKFIGVRDYLATLLFQDQGNYNSDNYLRYHVELASQSNNDSMGPKLLNDMMLAYIRLF